MISRRKIISKSEDSSSSSSSSSSASSSSDNLYKQHEDPYVNDDPYGGDVEEDDENTWTNFDQLVEDQLEEIRNKWNQIDDEIWAKIICFERNRRVAKAYARSQVISITGSERGFDGYRIGLNGFPNPKRDIEIQMIKQQIRSGLKLKIDDLGNIHIKRVGRCPVFLGSEIQTNSSNLQTQDKSLIKTSINGQNSNLIALELNKPRMIFDFKKFQHSLLSQSKCSSKPLNLLDTSTLQNQCVHYIQLVVDEEPPRLLRHPCWIILINIVALDLFWSKFKHDSPSNNNYSSNSISRKLLSANINHRRLKPKNPLYDPGEDDYDDDDENHDLYYCGYMAKISNSCQQDQQKQILSSSNAIEQVSKPLDKKELNSESGMTTPTKSRHIPVRPNPMKQLPTFNRIGLEQSKRLFFSSHQLSLCGDGGSHNEQQSTNEGKTKTEDGIWVKQRHLSQLSKYSAPSRHVHSHSSSSSSHLHFRYHHHNHYYNPNKYHQNSSKLNPRMKQTYRSTCDLLTN